MIKSIFALILSLYTLNLAAQPKLSASRETMRVELEKLHATCVRTVSKLTTKQIQVRDCDCLKSNLTSDLILSDPREAISFIRWFGRFFEIESNDVGRQPSPDTNFSFARRLFKACMPSLVDNSDHQD